MQTTTDKLIALLKDDGAQALKANQRASSLSQIEKIAGTRFSSVQDLYTYLRDERVWSFSIKADSIYRSWMRGKFSGRSWIILTPSFEDIALSQTVKIEDGTVTAAILVGVARAEKSLASRISKEKPRLEEAMAFLSGYKNYMPETPGSPEKPEDVVDAEFTEVPVLPAPSEGKPEAAKPAPSEGKPEAAKPAPSETPKPLYLETGIINSDRSALEAVLSAFQKTKSSSNKSELLAFRAEIKQALISAGLIDE